MPGRLLPTPPFQTHPESGLVEGFEQISLWVLRVLNHAEAIFKDISWSIRIRGHNAPLPPL